MRVIGLRLFRIISDIFLLYVKLLLYAFKTIHINNPKLPYYLLNKNEILYNQYKRINIK